MPFTMSHTANKSHIIDSRMQSPRPGTPEPSSRQGRRNTQPDAQLLDDDGAISQKVGDVSVSFSMSRLTHLARSSWKCVSSTSLRNIARLPHLRCRRSIVFRCLRPQKVHISPRTASTRGHATRMVHRSPKRPRTSSSSFLM